MAERNGQKLYVPVEQPTSPPPRKAPRQPRDEDVMDMDNSKHKVYIYDLDAELSDSESDDGKLVFLPDIEKHLRESRIPPSILANNDGELAGMNNQLVLYNIPNSLTVPEEQDSVRKAIIETRARARAKQEEKRITESRIAQTFASPVNGDSNVRDWAYGMVNGAGIPNGTAQPTEGEPSLGNDPDAMDLG